MQCHWEYPGYIETGTLNPDRTGALDLMFGDVYDTICGDVYDSRPWARPCEVIVSDIPSDTEDVNRVADFIVKSLCDRSKV